MPIDPDVRVDSVAGLRELYREPSSLVRRKVHTSLDAETAAAVRAARFVLVATVGADGHVDVSPRGGPPGFVQVDEGRILLPDLNGNNLIDSLINVVETGRIGLLVVHPGHDETLRVNGTAWVTADPDTTSRFDDVVRRPKTVIVIEPDEVFILRKGVSARRCVGRRHLERRHRCRLDPAVSARAARRRRRAASRLRAGLCVGARRGPPRLSRRRPAPVRSG
jgi:uncharacterized protein